jgi:Winged helix-turn-helix domain (DUF2582)
MASSTATSSSATSASASSQANFAPLERIGSTAGEIWHFLHTHGPQSITKLINALDAPRDTILQALGWLAREDKIQIDDDSRSRVVSLKQ